MPCPPSIEEQYSLHARNSTHIAIRFAHELRVTRALVAEALTREAIIVPNDEREALDRMGRERGTVERHNEPPWCDGQATASEVWAWRETCVEECERIENLLCRTRTSLMRISTDPADWPSDLRDAFVTERELHLRHRLADRAAVVRNLEHHIARLPVVHSLGDAPYKRLRRVKEMTDEELLVDRETLFALNRA